jgi:hypothetical protein
VLAILTTRLMSATESMAQATATLAEEARLARERANSPLIAVYFEFLKGGWILNVTVENVGTGLARDVGVQFRPSIPGHDGASISSLPVNSAVIPILKPGQKFSQFVAGAPAFFSDEAKNPLGYRAAVSARNQAGIAMELVEYPLDLSIYKGSRIADEKGLDDIAKSLKDISETLQRVLAWDAIKIKTPRDIEREEEAWHARAVEAKASAAPQTPSS